MVLSVQGQILSLLAFTSFSHMQWQSADVNGYISFKCFKMTKKTRGVVDVSCFSVPCCLQTELSKPFKTKNRAFLKAGENSSKQPIGLTRQRDYANQGMFCRQQNCQPLSGIEGSDFGANNTPPALIKS